MNQYLVLVANQSEAQLYQREQKFGELKPVQSFKHEEGRLHEGDLIANDPGMGSPSQGSGMDAKEPEHSAKETEAARFAKELTIALKQSLHNRAELGLVVIAAPAFLGHLREHVDDEVNQRVIFTIDKNLAPQDVSAVSQQIDNQLRPEG